MDENIQGKTSKGMGKGRRKQAREWGQGDKLQNISLWKKNYLLWFLSGQASERVSLVTRASEEEILETTWSSRKKEMD